MLKSSGICTFWMDAHLS